MTTWQLLIAPGFTLLGVVLTLAFTAKSQAVRLQMETQAAAAARGEGAERDDRRRFMAERRDAYTEFAAAVDAWIVEAQTRRYLSQEFAEQPQEATAVTGDDLVNYALRIRAALNHMTLISPLHVLGAAGRVNAAVNDDTVDPIGEVQPLLLEFLFECRRDLIGEAFWPSDLSCDEVDRVST